MVPGLDFVHEMQKATTTAKHTLAVLSPAYFTSQFAEVEWRVAFADDPSGEQRRLIPVRVVDFTPAGLLATRIYIDLVGRGRQVARTALLDGVKAQPAAVPTEEPAFPGEQPAAVEVFCGCPGRAAASQRPSCGLEGSAPAELGVHGPPGVARRACGWSRWGSGDGDHSGDRRVGWSRQDQPGGGVCISAAGRLRCGVVAAG
jgi:hypothetical protein